MDLLKQIQIHKGSSLPINFQLCDQIKWLISNEVIKAGERLPTIREAAEQLGVNMHTVRSAYHHLERMGLVTTRPREGTVVQPYRLFQTISEVGSMTTHSVGLIVTDFSTHFNEFMRGAEKAARMNNLLIVVATADGGSSLEKIVDRLLNYRVDGLMVACTGFAEPLSTGWAPSVLDLPIPLVSAGIHAEPHSAVLLDLEGAAYQVVTHLLEHRHSSIGIINVPEDWSCGKELAAGFQRGLREKGALINQVFINTVSRVDRESGYQAGIKLLSSNLRPTALCAVADELALGAMQAFGEKGYRVPEDLAVVGFGNKDFAPMIEPPLTTMELSMFKLGEQSMRMLSRLIQQKELACANEVLPVQLVVRRSCGCNL